MPLPVDPAMTRQLGAPQQVWAGGGAYDPFEDTPELQYPLNLRVYDRMRRSWSQGRAMLLAATLPILGTRWSLEGSTVDPQVMQFCEAELGLVVDEKGRRKTRPRGVNFDQALRHALLMLPFGFAPFEKVADVGPADPAGWQGYGGKVAHLKLAPLMPRSVEYIDVTPAGELLQIRQWITQALPGQQTTIGADGTPTPPLGSTLQLVPIGASKLVWFANEQEGAQWAGQSVFRAAYKHWLIGDYLIRADANAADRNGSGLPVVTYPTGAGPGARETALGIAQSVRTGDEAGVAIEAGWMVQLLGVQGSTHDTLASLKWHDEAASRGMLEMFLNLGHDGGLGHAGLGDTFVDYFLMAERAIIRYLEEIITEQVLSDLVAWNFGPGVAYPTLTADDPSAEATPTAAALLALSGAGLLVSDEPARQEIRRRYGFPAEDLAGERIPFLLPRGVTDPAIDPPAGSPLLSPTGQILALPAGGGPVIPQRGRPAAPPAPPTAPALNGTRLSAGRPILAAVAGQWLPGRIVGGHTSGAFVDVGGVVGLFPASHLHATADPVLEQLGRRHAELGQRLAQLGAA